MGMTFYGMTMAVSVFTRFSATSPPIALPSPSITLTLLEHQRPRSWTRLEANIFPIPLTVAGSLTIVPRPRGGDWLDDDVERLRHHDIHVLVSLLCDSERVELGLEEEAAACSKHNIEFISLPVPDLGVPLDTGAFIEAVHRLAALIHGGTKIAVHCRQSVGRSGLLAASIAVACGTPLQQALVMISKARGVPVPETPAQQQWLRRLEDRLGLT